MDTKDTIIFIIAYIVITGIAVAVIIDIIRTQRKIDERLRAGKRQNGKTIQSKQNSRETSEVQDK